MEIAVMLTVAVVLNVLGFVVYLHHKSEERRMDAKTRRLEREDWMR